MRRATLLLFGLLRLAFVPALSAQGSAVLAIGLERLNARGEGEATGRGARLAASYSLSLVSDWPQLALGTACFNGGQEALDGTLTRTSAGRYAGQLERRATILFCGVHGAAASACALTLRSRGPVEAHGEILPDAAGGEPPVVQLTWSAETGASEVTIEGDCPAAFNDSLRRMYLAVSHALEFPLPLTGEGARTTRLEDYGWIVEAR